MRRIIGSVFVFVSLACAAQTTAQQVVVMPSAGLSADGKLALEAAVGGRFHWVQPEVEIGWAHRGLERRADRAVSFDRDVPTGTEPDYQPAAVADVSTLMFRLVVPARVNRYFEPHGVIGVGLARATRQPPPGESLERTDTQAGIEAGAGATIWFTERFGFRGDATYFNVVGPPGNFHGAPGTGRTYTNVLRDFSLTRVTFGLNFRFGELH